MFWRIKNDLLIREDVFIRPGDLLPMSPAVRFNNGHYQVRLVMEQVRCRKVFVCSLVVNFSLLFI